MELWRDIRGYEGLYQVSNEGRVRSLDSIEVRCNGRPITIKGIILKLASNESNHLQVSLSKNGVKKTHKIHILVAEAFIPNPNGYNAVHHKNKNPKDNRVDNLVWMNRGEHSALHSGKRVDQIDKVTGEVLRQWNSTMDVERELGYNHRNISACCNNKYLREGNNVYKKSIWKYVVEKKVS